MKTCPKCHTVNPDIAKYCMNCGMPINSQNEQNIEPLTISVSIRTNSTLPDEKKVTFIHFDRLVDGYLFLQ